MKFHQFKPYIQYSFYLLILIVLIPVAFVLSGSVKFYFDSLTLLIMAICVVLLYCYLFLTYILRGFLALYDVFRRDTHQTKVIYENSFIVEEKFLLRRYNRLETLSTKRFVQQTFMEVCFTVEGSKEIFSLCGYHTMQPGEQYWITYGKKSKILNSIVDQDGVNQIMYME